MSGEQTSAAFAAAVVRMFLGMSTWDKRITKRGVSTLPYFDGYILGDAEPFVMMRFGYEGTRFMPFEAGISGGIVDGITAVPHADKTGLIVVVGKIQGYWEGPHTLRYGMQESPTVLLRNEYGEKEAFFGAVQLAIAAAENARIAEYEECPDCNRPCYPENRDSRGMCMTCAQTKHGIIY